MVRGNTNDGFNRSARFRVPPRVYVCALPVFVPKRTLSEGIGKRLYKQRHKGEKVHKSRCFSIKRSTEFQRRNIRFCFE